MNLSNAQTNETKMCAVHSIEVMKGYVSEKPYYLNNNLMLPLESVWNILAKEECGGNFIAFAKPVFDLEDNTSPLKINLNRNEFTLLPKIYHFEASDTIDGKIFISADFFVKAYDCQVFVDCNRQRVKVEDTYATCDVENAIAFIGKGSALRIKLKIDHEHEWKFNISPLNGIDSPIVSLGWDTRHITGYTGSLLSDSKDGYYEKDVYTFYYIYEFTVKEVGNYTITAENGIDQYVYKITVF